MLDGEIREIRREQDYLTMLYAHVDDARARSEARLAGILRDTDAPSRFERDAAAAWHRDQLARLAAAENRLCFGRLDLDTGERHYIGRIGLFDEANDADMLLLDWRAPAARPFYVATAASPQGVRRRRQIATRGRTVVALDDELLDATALDADGSDGAVAESGLTGEAALLASVSATRTGRMHDIVATLQAEQDAIIRAGHHGILVVQGGPGTGKTAVALHRAAFLLYTHERLAARGVLVVGPNQTFLGYIGQVLPDLGETSVLLATVADLYPGIVVDRVDPDRTVAVKGRVAMAEALAGAVRSRQVIPDEPVDVEFEGDTLRLDVPDCRRATARARAAKLPHNAARLVFQLAIVDTLVDRLAERFEAVVLTETGETIDGGAVDGRLGPADLRALMAAGVIIDPDEPPTPRALLDETGRADLRAALLASPGVRDAVDALWPELAPQDVVRDVLADPDRYAAALDDADRAALRTAGDGWSAADVPLLDEAASLLGGEPAKAPAGTAAQRAAMDRTWTFGHVIVDEAQELSGMAWRMLLRRCPQRSMTVVGDVAQTSDPAGATSWRDALAPQVDDRWRLARLTVNYRTPAEIMDATAGVLAAINPELAPPRSVRRTGVAPWRRRVPPGELGVALAAATAREEGRVGDGRLAVIVPADRCAELGAAVRRAVPDAVMGDDPDLTATVSVLTVAQAKGLEFDSVLIADPAAILAANARGANDLYVAMTRATHRLGILHPGPVPDMLARDVPVATDEAAEGSELFGGM